MKSNFSLFTATSFLFALFVVTPAHAFCTPDVSQGTACATAADKTCSQLGVSTMDGDKQNILACLASPSGSDCASGQCQWKIMSGGSSVNAKQTVYATSIMPENPLALPLASNLGKCNNRRGVLYTNNNSLPRLVSITTVVGAVDSTPNRGTRVWVDNIMIAQSYDTDTFVSVIPVTFVVPAGSTYKVDSIYRCDQWVEWQFY